MHTDELEKIIHRERKAVVIVNTRSRSGKRHYRHILENLHRQGYQVVAAYPVLDPARLRDVLREATQRDAHLLIVGGGDGTVTAVANELAHREDIALGIVPLGTGNSTARTLSIPLTVKQAVSTIVDGEVADVDLGRIGDRYFLNTIAVGLTADAVRTSSTRFKRYFGQLAYFLTGVSAFIKHRFFQCMITAEGQEFVGDVHEVVVANGRFFGDTILTPDASIQDGQLNVETVERTNIWQFIWRMLRFLVFRRSGLSGEHHFSTTEVRIDTDPPQCIDIDGESFITTPVTVSVEPRALKVMVPRHVMGI